MVVYIYQCYSLESSHPLLPSLCPQDCPPRLHLYFCPANRFTSNIFSIFYTYALTYVICLVFFFLTSPFITGSRFIHLISTNLNLFLFNDWIIFHCIYVPLLHLFICPWIHFIIFVFTFLSHIFSQSSMFHQALYLCMCCSFGLECFFLISLSSKPIFRLKYLGQAPPPFLPPLSTQVELTTPPLCVCYFYSLKFLTAF